VPWQIDLSSSDCEFKLAIIMVCMCACVYSVVCRLVFVYTVPNKCICLITGIGVCISVFAVTHQ
jgi:hypothetical protein